MRCRKLTPGPWEAAATAALFEDAELGALDREHLAHWFGWLQDQQARGRLTMPPGPFGKECTSCPPGTKEWTEGKERR